MDRAEIIRWLEEDDGDRLESLWARADEVRLRNVGDDVHLRGLVEFSNHCARLCGYCGLRADNTQVERYRMSRDEILACAADAVEFGYGTVVLQSGEDYGIEGDWITDIVATIKATTPLAITLSLGERSDDELAAWRAAGADRYLLRFETSNAELYQRIHPASPGRDVGRMSILRTLKGLGYETGSGVMIGIPGQTYDDLANDIEAFVDLGLDMIGVGPFIAHSQTPLGNLVDVPACDHQVPNTELMTYKVVALTRIACPTANIPSTTALATLNIAEGRELGLCRGANVVMPNLTPAKYRALYEIYPAKACVTDDARTCNACMKGRIERMGRTVGRGRGDSPQYCNRSTSVTVPGRATQ